jgi:hypothetical protein
MLRQYLESHCAMRASFNDKFSARDPTEQYICLEDFVLDRGHSYEQAALTPDELDWVHQLEGLWVNRYGLPKFKECFHTSQWMAYSMVPFLPRTVAVSYVEGYAIHNGLIPMLHGWLAVNGKVVDFTWRTSPFEDGLTDAYTLGTWGEGSDYFGVKFSDDDVLTQVMKGETRSLIDNWEDGFPVLQLPRLKPPTWLEQARQHKASFERVRKSKDV